MVVPVDQPAQIGSSLVKNRKGVNMSDTEVVLKGYYLGTRQEA